MSLNPDYLKKLFIDQVKPCLSKGGGDIPAVIQELTVTENGTYEAPEGVDGYGPVVVEVASAGGGDEVLNALIDRSITEISNNATSIGNYAFYLCSSLATANFPVATSIGNYTFQGCSKLTTANSPAVTSIGDYAFYQCHALATLDFSAVTSIARYAFRECSRLIALILRSDVMCSLSNTNAFSSTPIKSGTGYIYVPRALIEDYKVESNWSTYAAQFRALEDYTVDGTTTGALDESKI